MLSAKLTTTFDRVTVRVTDNAKKAGLETTRMTLTWGRYADRVTVSGPLAAADFVRRIGRTWTTIRNRKGTERNGDRATAVVKIADGLLTYEDFADAMEYSVKEG